MSRRVSFKCNCPPSAFWCFGAQSVVDQFLEGLRDFGYIDGKTIKNYDPRKET